jgi:phosphonoacetate hydrolase
VFLNSPQQAARATEILTRLTGVETVMTRADAAKKFHLMPERIGELVVLGDKDTVFGETNEEVENLPPTFRTHGSLYESQVPLLIYNASGALPAADRVEVNFDMMRTLFR